jgi:apolipoprotein N-acyltransferase
MPISTKHEEAQATESSPVTDRGASWKARSWIWLGLAMGLLLFANGANSIAIAAWLAPVFLLRFVREQSPVRGLPVTYLALTAGFAFQFRGMVPIPGAGYLIFLLFYGLSLVFPYVLDRLLRRKLSGLSATLLFPSTWAFTEYLVSRGPFASWGSAAYSQYGNLALLQLLSVTGLWGVAFLMGWFAAVCNQVWEQGLDSREARRSAWIFATTLCAVILLGGARLSLFPPTSQTVRVASLSRRRLEPQLSDTVAQRMFAGKATNDDMDAIRRWAVAIEDDLLSRAEREMEAGAKIVFWGEANAPVLKEAEPAFVSRGAALASKYNAYLGMALGVLNQGNEHPIENKLVLIQPDGRVAWEYHKTHPVPGPEAAVQFRGDGKLRELDTLYGRLSSIICFDADFPQLLAQAGILRADVVLDPSNDWRAIDPWHTQMASFRAIEQGFHLIRQTSQGLSAAFDYQGRRLAAMDHYQTTEYSMVSEVPTKGTRTIYSVLGDWFAWVCLVTLGVLIWRGWFQPGGTRV